MITLSWLTQFDPIPSPCLIFPFNSVADLIAGRVSVHYASMSGYAQGLCLQLERGDAEDILKRAAKQVSVKKHRRGRLTEGTGRDVYPLINDPTLPFRAGLTVHAARGSWSSLPHAFEKTEILSPRPMPFYEKFAYMSYPVGGWGVQVRQGHLFDANLEANSINNFYGLDSTLDWVNEARIIRDRDILDIPLGSHPVAGGPGYIWAYWWVYVSDTLMWGQREKFK